MYVCCVCCVCVVRVCVLSVCLCVCCVCVCVCVYKHCVYVLCVYYVCSSSGCCLGRRRSRRPCVDMMYRQAGGAEDIEPLFEKLFKLGPDARTTALFVFISVCAHARV